MPVPWVQIVQWVPSILEVSRQILNETRKKPPGESASAAEGVPADVIARITRLEENERRQAELINQMAEHMGQLTQAITALHRQTRWLIAAQVVLVIVVVVALLA